MEYCQAVRGQLATLGLSGMPKKRWRDYLPEDAVLKSHYEVIEGIDVYRAAQALVMGRRDKIEPRRDDPADFSKNVALAKQVMQTEDLQRWKHDFNNLLCILVSNVADFLSVRYPFLNGAAEKIRQLIRLNQGLPKGGALEFWTEANRILPFISRTLNQFESYRLSDDDKCMIQETKAAVERFIQRLRVFKHMLDGSKEFAPIAMVDYLNKFSLTNQFFSDMNIQVDLELTEDIVLRGVAADLDRAFENLIKNAREAGRDCSGTLQVKVYARQVTEEELEKMVTAIDSEAVYFLLYTKKTRPNTEVIQIRVSDSGSGIPPENRKYLFRPDFTTKGEGRGRGLESVFTIIKNHGGHIFVDHDETMQGACFSILLPAFKEKQSSMK